MLEVKNLRHSFGDFVAVDDISFDIQKGEILGLIGQNGAGKTTTFRLILDFLKKEEGTILWNGKEITQDDYDRIGYLPEERGLYLKETIESQLIYFGRLRGKSKAEIKNSIDFWMEKFQVKGKKADKVKSLSKGNQQKVQLIATLIHEPDLVILDEPFSGLDPVNAELLKQAVLELKERGACVIFSDHNMDNVEQMVDKMIMMKQGKIILDGTVKQIRESFGRTELFLDGLTPETLEKVKEVPGILEVVERKDGSYQLNLKEESVGKEIFEVVRQSGYISTFNQQPPTLEEIFKLKAGVDDVR